MENSDKDTCLNDGFQVQFSTKESEGELPLHAEAGIDETENTSSALNCCIDEEALNLEKELKAICQTIEIIKKVTSDVENRCEICYKEFSAKGNLTTHLRIHTGERPHKCKKCEKTFKTKSHLNRHLLTHTDERPHCCKTCGLSFRINFNLRRHLLTHTKERPHVCNACNKTFAREDKLKQHLRTHNVDKP